MRADRLVSIIMLLQSRGKMTTQSLAAELDVSRRTILRDIDALSFAGIPVYAEGGHGGGVALDENYRTTLTGLNEDEIQALFLVGNQRLLEEIGLGEAVESTQRKLTAALPTQHQPSVTYIRQRIYIDPLWWWHDSEPMKFWADLQRAVYEDCTIEVIYEKYNGEISQRTLEPYGLVAKSSLWYLVARDIGRDPASWRTFRVARLREVHLLTSQFQRDPTFDLATYWHEHLEEFMTAFSEYEFTLRIHPEQVNLARWLTPGRNRIVRTAANGWVTIHFQLDNRALAEMLVFGLGAMCEVVEPDTLKDAVKIACTTLIAHLESG